VVFGVGLSRCTEAEEARLVGHHFCRLSILAVVAGIVVVATTQPNRKRWQFNIKDQWFNQSPGPTWLALSVPLSRFTPRAGGVSATLALHAP